MAYALPRPRQKSLPARSPSGVTLVSPQHILRIRDNSSNPSSKNEQKFLRTLADLSIPFAFQPLCNLVCMPCIATAPQRGRWRNDLCYSFRWRTHLPCGLVFLRAMIRVSSIISPHICGFGYMVATGMCDVWWDWCYPLCAQRAAVIMTTRRVLKFYYVIFI